MNEKNGQSGQKWTDHQSILLDWLSIPKLLREPKTQTELADKLGIRRQYLSEWQNLDGFKEERLKRMFRYFTPDTPDIIAALKEKALEGNVQAITTWLDKVEQIASELNIKGNFSFRDLYEAIINKRSESTESSEVSATSKTEASSG